MCNLVLKRYLPLMYLVQDIYVFLSPLVVEDMVVIYLWRYRGVLTSLEITFKSRYLLAYAKRKCGEEFLRQPWDARLHGDQLLFQSLVIVF